MEDNKNYERGEHLENITDASMKDDDYFNASRNIDRKYITIEGARENNLKISMLRFQGTNLLS